MKKAQFEHLDALDYSGAEAINTICSNLSFAGRNLRKIVLTSCTSGDGKSYLSLQIARNMAQRGMRVLLMDCDLRKSQMVSRYGIAASGELTGLAHYLAGHNSLEECIFETNFAGLHFMPTGKDVANPIPLLLSPAFPDLMDYLAQKYDMVIVDAPPVGLVIDAAEIARTCDGIVLVVRHNYTHRSELQEASHQLLQTGTPILGCVLNGVSFKGITAKKYYNKSYYSHYGDYYRKGSGKSKAK